MKIVSVDVGTRNLAIAIYLGNKLTFFHCYDLLSYAKKKKERTDYCLLVYNFIQSHPELFQGMDKILIENQIQRRMVVIATSLRCFFYSKAVKISPLAVHNHFKSGTGNHRQNKKAAIKLVERFVTKKQLETIRSHKKKDDISDAIIQIFYYIQKNSKN